MWRTLKTRGQLFSLLCHPMCSWVLSSLCLLTRLSGSSDSWPRNKSRIVPFLNGFGWKLAIKSGTTPREDTGEPNWVYQEPHIQSGTHFCCVKVCCILTESQSITAVWTAHGRNGMFGSWCFLTSGPFGSEINMWNLLLELLLYYSGLWWCTEQIPLLSGGKKKKNLSCSADDTGSIPG